jgi:hypothetical protein
MLIVFSLCAAYVAYCLGTNPAGPLTTPDSIHYLNASPIVPLGYPFFLKLTGASGAIVVQPIVFGAALAFLGRELARHTRSTMLAVAVLAGIMALPQLRVFHASILSESVFLSLSVVFLALAVRFTYQPAWQFMMLLALTAGVTATVRRTGVALVPVMLFMVLAERHRLRGSQAALLLVAALVPFGVVLGAEQAISPMVHAGHSSSLMGRHMFAKAALIGAPDAPPDADRLTTGLNQHLQSTYAPIRDVLATAPRDLRGVLSMYYETCLQGGCADESRRLMPDLDEADQTRIMGAVGLARIRRAPLAFLDLLALNYQSLWTVDRLRYPGRAEALTAFIAAHRPLPQERMALSLQPDQVMEFQPSARVRYMQIVISLVGIWTAGVAIAGLSAVMRTRPPAPLFALAATAALAAHGGLLLTAILAAGFSRFMQGLWPAIVMASVCGAWALLPSRATAR